MTIGPTTFGGVRASFGPWEAAAAHLESRTIYEQRVQDRRNS
jgi:hypothetical protein